MNLIPSIVAHKVSMSLFKTKANSPKILFAVGLAGVVTSTVLACRATMKLSPALDNFKEELDEVKSGRFNTHESTEVNKREQNKDLAYVYLKGTTKIVKLYAPTIIIGSLSIAALTTSHVQLTKRNASLVAAFSALQTAYDSYRERVREEIGAERELDIYQNARTEKVTVDGKVKDIKIVDPTKHSIYARFFDEYSENWQKSSEANRVFLQAQQNYFNHILQVRRHVFLNEVYHALGLEHSSAGALVGWMIDNGGDNFIDFGIFDVQSRKFVNNLERSILLDFNVDGVIYDKLQ